MIATQEQLPTTAWMQEVYPLGHKEQRREQLPGIQEISRCLEHLQDSLSWHTYAHK